MTTLTIRIDADLKDDVLMLAREHGEDASTWIRQFFERIRRVKSSPSAPKWMGDEEGEFSETFIREIQQARRKGSFRKFNVKEYV